MNPPGEEMGLNHRARASSRLVVTVVFFLMQTFLMTKLAKKQKLKNLIVYANLSIMWFVHIYHQIQDSQSVSRKDVVAIAMCVISTILSSSLFACVIRRMDAKK